MKFDILIRNKTSEKFDRLSGMSEEKILKIIKERLNKLREEKKLIIKIFKNEQKIL